MASSTAFRLTTADACPSAIVTDAGATASVKSELVRVTVRSPEVDPVLVMVAVVAALPSASPIEAAAMVMVSPVASVGLDSPR